MTQERLRELLRERVADETMPDASAAAWQRAGVVRRRHRLGAVAGVVAATVGVSGVVAVLDSRPPEPPPADSVPTPAADQPDATYQGVPVWFSPDQREEQQLAPVGQESSLPDVVDFVTTRPYVAGELDRAVAAFSRGRDVVLLGPDGELRTVDARRVEKVTKPNGYSSFPFSASVLSADGARLAFPQEGHDLVFSVRTGTWSTAPAGTAVEEQPRPEVPFDVGAAQPYGTAHEGAASWGMGLRLPARPDAVADPGPEFMVVSEATGTRWRGPVPTVVLAFTWLAGNGQDGRYKNCCAVAGWLSDGWVVYESRQTRGLLVGWRVGTHEFRMVTRIEGPYDVASFALTP